MKRVCNLCGIQKDISAYRKDSKGKLGFAVRCSACKELKRKKKEIAKMILANADTGDEFFAEKAKRELQHEKPVFTQRPVSVDNSVYNWKKLGTNKVEIEGEKSVFERVREKYGKFSVLTVEESGKSQLTIHFSPPRIFKGMSEEEVYRKALA